MQGFLTGNPEVNISGFYIYRKNNIHNRPGRKFCPAFFSPVPRAGVHGGYVGERKAGVHGGYVAEQRGRANLHGGYADEQKARAGVHGGYVAEQKAPKSVNPTVPV